MSYRTLLLNSSYEPMLVIDWKDAVRLVFTNKCEMIETYEDPIKTATKEYPRPSVVRLHTYVKRKHKGPKFSRDNIFRRDGYKC